MDAERLHQESIVIDGACPLLGHQDYYRNWMAGGATAALATVGYGLPGLGAMGQTLKNIGAWFRRFREHPDQLRPVWSVKDIHQAKNDGQLGIIFHFQGSLPFEDDLNSLEVFYRLGLRVVQLCYNTADQVGCGCTVAEDTGLTGFGREVITEMNRLGLVVDCAHTGTRTTLEALEVSRTPVIVSHANSRAVCDSNRNLTDDLIRAIAANGGVVGLNGYPAFVSTNIRPGLNDLLDHADHIMALVGPDHLSLGLDYFEYQAGVVDEATAQVVYDYLLESGAWAPGEYPPPPWHFPQGVEMPEKLPNLTAGLLDRGYQEEDIRKILGLNLLRVFDQVW